MFKNNLSSFVYLLLYVEWNFIFTLRNSVWSGQNLINRTVCYGLAVTHVAKQAKTANFATLIKQSWISHAWPRSLYHCVERVFTVVY